MIARTEPACLLIADIAGYSSYLAGVELDHAPFSTQLIAHGPGRTDLVYRMARPRSAKDRSVLEAMEEPMRAMLTSTAAPLIELAGADAAARAAARSDEPELPRTTARHLTAPVPTAGGPIDFTADDGGAGRS